MAEASKKSRRKRADEAVARGVQAVRDLIAAIQHDDEALLDGVLALSRRHRIFAPLAFTLGAFAMLFDGLKVLLANRRLMLIQVLPAMWIWLAMLDLKMHLLHGKSFNEIRGPILIPLGLAVMALTMAAFYLNAVFAFAVAGSRPPQLKPAFDTARTRRLPILVSGAVVGIALAVAVLIAPRWGPPWFAVTLGVTVGVMMVCYVAIPSRLIGVKKVESRRDKFTASLISGAIGTTVCTPPYLMGRIGILMLGSKLLLIPGIILLALGLTLQAGATGGVRAMKMSVLLVAGGAAAEPKVEPAVRS